MKYSYFGCFDGTHNTSATANHMASVRSYAGSIACGENCKVYSQGKLSVCFWGELYNKTDLQKYRTEDEASIVSRLYQNKNIDAFRLLNGKFTLAIVDVKRIVLCRDLHGIGPSVYYTSMFFADSLDRILHSGNCPVHLNREAVSIFLSLGNIPSPDTAIKGIKKLAAGNCLICENGSMVTRPVYDFDDFIAQASTSSLSLNDAAIEYERLHKRSIELQISGKKSIGLLLSGGYDSGGNIVSLRDIYDGKATAYSIGFKNNPLSETPIAQSVADKFGVELRSYEIDGHEIDYLPELIHYLGDPFHESGLIINYMAMKTIAENPPDVVLGGDGNDQYFGTAARQLALHYIFKKTGLHHAQKLLSRASALNAFENNDLLFKIGFHNETILNVMRSNILGFSNSQAIKLVRGFDPHKNSKTLSPLSDSFANFNDLYSAHNYFIDIVQSINEVILFKASRMSNMFSVPLAFPYADLDIYNFLKTLPHEYKCNGSLRDVAETGGVSKYLFKSYMKPLLPREVSGRKKQGGFAPLPTFYSNAVFRKKIENYLLTSTAAEEMFDKKYLKFFFTQLDESFRAGNRWFWYRQIKASQMTNLLVLTIWWEKISKNISHKRLSEYLR